MSPNDFLCCFFVFEEIRSVIECHGRYDCPGGSYQPFDRTGAREVGMPRFTKHLVAVLMLAGGVLLAGTSFVGAHKPGSTLDDPDDSCHTWKHRMGRIPSRGHCSYSCILNRPLKIRVIPETRRSRMYDFSFPRKSDIRLNIPIYRNGPEKDTSTTANNRKFDPKERLRERQKSRKPMPIHTTLSAFPFR